MSLQTPASLFVGAWITYGYPDERGILRSLTGKVTALGVDSVTFRSDGGQRGFHRDVLVTVKPSEVELSTSPFAPANPARRYWRVTQGTSKAKVLAPTFSAAVERAAAIGFRNPDSVVLDESM